MSDYSLSFDDGHIYFFEPEMNPALTVESKSFLTIETVDSLEGLIQTDDDLLDSIPQEVNAATGPIEIEGALPGDILAVHIEDVRPGEDLGRVLTAPGFGLLQDDNEIDHPSTTVTPVEGGVLTFLNWEIEFVPVIGTIGVATEGESYSTLVPHDHGGNLDTSDVTIGSTIYFPVFQEGAMLAMGDAKAAMADGEMCGTGSEIAVGIDATVELIKEPEYPLNRPFIETDSSWKTLASAETLEDACRLAHGDMLNIIQAEEGIDRTKAYHFSSLVGGLEISQVVDPLVTVRNAMPKAHLDVSFSI